MHMADALVSGPIGISMYALSTAGIGYSVYKMNKEEVSEKKIPLMAVSGAFVFAAQMVNFTIPGTGSSGHIGGGILLAALLGPYPALLTIATVLIIQCLFFADGGLLALGANIFNMGIIPCLLVYPLLFNPILKKSFNKKRIMLASVISCVLGLQLGSFGVVLETTMSNIVDIPFQTFLLLMQPIHLAIGFIEGVITSLVLVYVHSIYPQIFENTLEDTNAKQSIKKLVLSLAIASFVIGGGVALAASQLPDGLEWSLEKATGSTEVESKDSIHENASALQESTAIMPDYDYSDGNGNGTSIAGLIGGLFTFLFAGIIGLILYFVKKKRKH